MKTKIIIFFMLYNLFAYSQCNEFFKSEYDEFEKRVENEFEYKLVFDTFKVDNGDSYIGSHLGFRWRDTFYNEKEIKGWSKYYWAKNSIYKIPNIEKNNNSIELDFWAKIQICEGLSDDCWEFTGFNKHLFLANFGQTMGFEKWEKYLKKEIDYLSEYPYIHFLANNGDDLKIYLKYEDYSNTLYLNDIKYPRTIDNYNWLLQHKVKKIRIHNVRTNKNLDIEIPDKDGWIFKEIILCIENFKNKIENNVY